MEYINFPGIGLEFRINKILFEFGSVKIYWYGFLIVLAFVIGLLLLKKMSKESKFEFDNILELFVLLVPTCIISARLYYVLFNLEYYSKNIGEIFNINSGGLAIYGGIIGGALVTYIYAKFKKIDYLKILDMIAIVLPLGQAIGRWGNFFNVEAFGSETDSILRMGIYNNDYYTEVHPTFLYESLLCFMIFVFLYLYRNKEHKFKGENLCIYLFLYGIIRMFIEGLRMDSLMFLGFRVSQIVSLILVIVSGIVFIYKKATLNNETKSK